jgi:hypothetical protein
MPYKSKEQQRLYFANRRREAKLSKARTLEEYLALIEGCSVCKSNPAVLLTEESIPICREHWEMLADSEIEFGADLSEEACVR